MTPAFVLHAVRRWWKVAAPIGILLAVVSVGVVWVLFKPMYLAVGRIQILDQQPFIAFATSESANKKYVQTQLQLLKLPNLLRRVLSDHPEIRNHPELLAEPDPLEYLAKTLTVKSIGDSEFYAIEYKSADRAHAKKVVDAVIDSYMEYVAAYESKYRLNLQKSLDAEIVKWKENVVELSKQLQRLTEATGLRPTPTRRYGRAHRERGIAGQYAGPARAI